MNPKKDGFVILSVATRRVTTENAPVWMEHKSVQKILAGLLKLAQ